ncbi:MAG: hypothetical protein CVU49_04805 [Candidatus Cloacimonetes bacterium HGW-Cloacimonetes-2]|nr:MAG: hypothetical protein CVU49_04805 [Candidatus Cloacimonetes bacterium HGW-Cloacimonetes-2]
MATRGSPEQRRSFASGFKREGFNKEQRRKRGFTTEKAENSGEKQRTALRAVMEGWSGSDILSLGLTVRQDDAPTFIARRGGVGATSCRSD